MTTKYAYNTIHPYTFSWIDQFFRILVWIDGSVLNYQNFLTWLHEPYLGFYQSAYIFMLTTHKNLKVFFFFWIFEKHKRKKKQSAFLSYLSKSEP